MTKKAFAPRELIGENRPTLWMAPLLAVVTLFYLYPAFEVLRFSITDASLLEPNYEYTLNTFKNVLSDPVLYKVIRITAIFVAGERRLAAGSRAADRGSRQQGQEAAPAWHGVHALDHPLRLGHARRGHRDRVGHHSQRGELRAGQPGAHPRRAGRHGVALRP